MCRQEQDAKTSEHEPVWYDDSTLAQEPIRSVVRVVIEHRNIARQRYQKWTSPLVARIPLTLVTLPL